MHLAFAKCPRMRGLRLARPSDVAVPQLVAILARAPSCLQDRVLAHRTEAVKGAFAAYNAFTNAAAEKPRLSTALCALSWRVPRVQPTN